MHFVSSDTLFWCYMFEIGRNEDVVVEIIVGLHCGSPRQWSHLQDRLCGSPRQWSHLQDRHFVRFRSSIESSYVVVDNLGSQCCTTCTTFRTTLS